MIRDQSTKKAIQKRTRGGEVAVIVLTHNEELHLERCLRSVATFASSVFVIDSGSRDRTITIAGEQGATVLQHPWKNHAVQFQWALDTIQTDANWIMRLDADEFIEQDLAQRIAKELPLLPPETVGVSIDRKHIFMNRWIRHGGRYPLRLLRIFRRGHGRIEQRWMDEHLVVTGGGITHFPGGFVDHNLNDLSFFIDKHNRYATREAIDVLNRRYRLFPSDSLRSEHTTRQTSTKRWIKESFYNHIPFPVSSVGYFLYRYFIQLGFLDGLEGLIYHGLQCLWYRFLVGAKLIELERAISGLEDRTEIVKTLETASGQQLH